MTVKNKMRNGEMGEVGTLVVDNVSFMHQNHVSSSVVIYRHFEWLLR